MLQGKEYDCSELGFVDKYSKVQYVTDPSKIKILLMGIYLFIYFFKCNETWLLSHSPWRLPPSHMSYHFLLSSFKFPVIPDNQMRFPEFVTLK